MQGNTKDMIRFENVSFGYGNDRPAGANFIFSNLDLSVKEGEYLALVGPNGSGKTTLAMLTKGLLSPLSGNIFYRGEDVPCSGINQRIGCLFSNPENQFVSPVVEEEVAFGPENQGRNSKDIADAVLRGLEMTGVAHLRHGLTHLLSGGEQQKVLISGILAMEVECIIFDEAGSMLDPYAKRELLKLLKKLNSEDGITVIHITHSLEEILDAGRLLALIGGRFVFDGVPSLLIQNDKMLKSLGLKLTKISKLTRELVDEGVISGSDAGGIEAIEEAICLSSNCQL